MKNTDFDDLLKKLAATPVPSPPANLSACVWREIRARRERVGGFATWIEELAGRIWAKDFAFASVAAALTIGISLAWIWQPQFKDNAAATSYALGLRVFSEAPPTLKLAGLARNP